MTTDSKMKPTVQGVGFAGIGQYSRLTDIVAYKTWANMINRCYNPTTHSYKPTYADCRVSKKWHNFQNFARWYYKNYPQDGKKYQLDKDKIKPGNKVYSPENCCFISQTENTQLSCQKSFVLYDAKGRRVKSKNISKFCEKRGLSKSSIGNLLLGKIEQHKGWTVNNNLQEVLDKREKELRKAKLARLKKVEKKKAEHREKLASRTKVYKSPNGKKVVVNNCAQFCRDNDLHDNTMRLIHTGKVKTHRGWSKW